MIKKIAIFLGIILVVVGLLTAKQYIGGGLTYHWPVGQKLTYKINFNSKGASYGSKLKSVLSMVGDHKINVKLKGELHIHNQGVYKDGYLLFVTLSPSEFIYEYFYSGSKQITPPKELKFYVQWNEKNGFSNIFIEESPVREYEHLIRDLLNVIQFKVPSDTVLSWSTIHEVISVKENVAYDYSPRFLFGLWGGCLAKKFETKNNKLKTEGVINICFDKSNVIFSIKGSKSEKYLSTNEIISDATKHISLDLLSISHTKEIKKIDLSNYQTRNIEGTYIKQRMAKKSDKQVVEGRTLERIMEPLNIRKSIEISDQANVFAQIAAFLRLYPEKTLEVEAMWQQYEATDFQFSLISTALRSSGTAESRAALQRYVDANEIGPGKSQVLLNLAMMSPETGTVQNYWKMYEEAETVNEAAHALMGLGIMASKSEDGSELKKGIIDRIASEYKRAESLEEKRNFIKTMANTRDDTFTKVLVDTIEKEEPLKLSVIESFKEIKNSTSKNILLNFAQSKDAQVRYSSYKSLATHEIDSQVLKQYEHAIYNEEKRHIVEVVLVNMKKQKNNKEVKSIARDYIGKCPTEKLCKLARSI